METMQKKKESKSNASFKKNGTIHFGALEKAKTCQKHRRYLLDKKPKTITQRLHETYIMILNYQTYLRRLLKTICLASIPVKPLE